MTTEQKIDKALEIIRAFKEGKEIWRDDIPSLTEYQITTIEVLLFCLSKQPDRLHIRENIVTMGE